MPPVIYNNSDPLQWPQMLVLCLFFIPKYGFVFRNNNRIIEISETKYPFYILRRNFTGTRCCFLNSTVMNICYCISSKAYSLENLHSAILLKQLFY